MSIIGNEGKSPELGVLSSEPKEKKLTLTIDSELRTIVNDINKLTLTMCHCEQSEAISRDCHACVPCLRRSGFAQAGVTPLRCADTSLPAYRQAGAPRNDYFSGSFTIITPNLFMKR